MQIKADPDTDRLIARGEMQVYVAFRAKDASTLIAALSVGYEFPVDIELPCGRQVTFESLRDVPARTMACPCGNSKHFVVKYEADWYTGAPTQ